MQSDNINELATALARAQGEIENASKASVNPHFRSKYADLAECLNTVRPVFSKHGLAVTQFPSYENGIVSVTTVLTHASGQWMKGVISAPVSKQDAQGVGSATTYCRRYALAAVAGIAQEDDDANSAVGHAKKPEPARDDGVKPVSDAEYDALCQKNADSIQCIKDGIAEGRLSTAAEAWFELDDETKGALWKAPSKGGVFTTKEREVMRTAEFKQSYYGVDK